MSNDTMRGSRRVASAFAVACALGALAGEGRADPPAGYYATVDARTPAALRRTLHEVIDDHTRIPYTSTATDTWDVLDEAQQDPANPAHVLDVYRNASYPKAGGGNAFYNREHAWPKSYGFPVDGVSNLPFTDCHHLWLGDSGYNSSRGNKPYRTCAGCSAKETLPKPDGAAYPGTSNWTTGTGATGAWETWVGRRGDLARALFYMDVRYEGGKHGVTGVAEPDLILTDDMSRLVADTKSNLPVGYMGALADLLGWHGHDGVDAFERRRHEVIAGYQGNRNPFVDHPEWAACLFQRRCALPWINEIHYDNAGADVGEMVEVAGYAGTNLSGWRLIGYNGANGVPYDTVNLSGVIPDQGGCMGAVSFAFPGLQNGAPDGVALIAADGSTVQLLSYEGSFTATSGPASGIASTDILVTQDGSGPAGSSLRLTGGGDAYGHMAWNPSAAASPGAANAGQGLQGHCGAAPVPTVAPWINELHYENVGADTGEFVEIAGPAGLDLSGHTLVAYNGNDGKPYKTVKLTGTLPDQQGGYGTLRFDVSALQGGPDGLALVDPSGKVLLFLSYGGVMTATSGPAVGTSSVDIGVEETTSTAVGSSLRLTGTGHAYTSFRWQAAAPASPGAVNAGQTLR